MARLLFIFALLVVGGLFVYNLSGHMEHVAHNYNSDNVMDMIENMEAPAAGGNEQ